jgi:hypothetical protein
MRVERSATAVDLDDLVITQHLQPFHDGRTKSRINKHHIRVLALIDFA